MKKFKAFITIIVFAYVVASITGCASKKNSKISETVPKQVNIGVQTLVTPELLLREEGIYEKYLGIPVNLLQFDSGADVSKALASGSIDIGVMGTSVVATAVSNGVDLEVIWFADVIGAAEALVMKAESGVTSIENIHGKIATPFVSTAHFSLLNALSSENIDMTNIKLIDMQPADIYAAWARGDIDGAYVWYPELGELLSDNGVIVTDSAEQALNGAMTADLIVVRKDFAEKNPNIVTAYLNSQMDAVNEYRNNTDSAVKKIADELGISISDAYSQVEGFIYLTGEEQLTVDYLGDGEKRGEIVQVLKNTSDFLASQGSISESPEIVVFEDIVNPKYLRDAMEGQ